MGYFNYFIKCIIRNIAYRLCKPKILLTILLSVAILFGLKHFGYCTLDDTDYEMIADGFATITANQGTIISQLSSMGVNVGDIESQLNTIKSMINDINDDTTNIANRVSTIINKIDTLNTNILNIYNKLDANQKELLTELEKDNNAVLEELQKIRDALNGSDVETAPFSTSSVSSSSNSVAENVKLISIDYEKGYTYTVKFTYRNPYSGNMNIYLLSSNNALPNGFVPGDYPFVMLDTVPPNTDNYVLEYSVPSSHPKYIYVSWGSFATDVVVERQISGLTSSIDKNNDLQQEGNQLQQEQNNFLKDDNVETDGFEFATNDTNNPTEDGFNTLFTSIYNAFCNTSSEPLTVTLPYVNQAFTIQPDLVSNAMQKCGLGFVATLIQSFYYYGVCLFIYKDINKIIEHLKSGNLTADCGNVKTEVL